MKKEQGFTLTELLMVFAMLAWFAVVGGIIWVAVHFAMKFW